ncbi:MAG: cupin domain-containing protein [Pseudomonadota bacterium]
MNPLVIRTDEVQEYYTAERCHILELSNTPRDDALSVARARVEPGVTTAFHRVKDTVERYVILSGSGRVNVEGMPEEDVSAGDVVLIPPNARQRIHNTGSVDLVFLALCTPRFRPNHYIHDESESA